ncbi:MAG: helix-turn-helix domain-containing protein [Rhizobium sp.]|nr:helix-turn-helix domain-containing protein [Rhizobium sp.]MBW8319260.1 helix-turn-helix domain-containing protein [Rhizobium sp.]
MVSVAKRQTRARKNDDERPEAASVEAAKISSHAALFHWLKEVSRLTPELGGKGVAFALRLFIARNKRDGFSFPSHKTIARDLGVSEASTYRYQARLIENGLLLVEKRKMDRARHLHNLYFLALPTGTKIGGKSLENNDIELAPMRGGYTDDLSPVRGRERGESNLSGEDGGKPGNAASFSATTSHHCEVGTSHQCETNHILCNQGEPTGSPLQGSVPEFDVVAREEGDVPCPNASGAPEARPDEAFRLGLKPYQISFYDKLPDEDQARYRAVPARRRDEWQHVWDYQHGIEDDQDD